MKQAFEAAKFLYDASTDDRGVSAATGVSVCYRDGNSLVIVRRIEPDMIEVYEPKTARFADLSPREQDAVLARVMRGVTV